MIRMEREWLSSGEPEKMLPFLQGKASKRKIALFRCAGIRRLWPLIAPKDRQALADSEQEAETLTGLADRWDLWLPLIPIIGGRLDLDRPYNGEGERWARSKLLRDIFGPLPFRPIVLDLAWLAWSDGTVRRLAQAIYDERAFERMPILADALEEAGCADADILNHCRQPSEHVRGCWVVDLILGKS
ncbi:MAG: hypothetical protein ACRELG_30310 [Gemmataceae bacterium]